MEAGSPWDREEGAGSRAVREGLGVDDRYWEALCLGSDIKLLLTGTLDPEFWRKGHATWMSQARGWQPVSQTESRPFRGFLHSEQAED